MQLFCLPSSSWAWGGGFPLAAASEAIIALNLTSETATRRHSSPASSPRCQQNMARAQASCRVASQGHSGWPLGGNRADAKARQQIDAAQRGAAFSNFSIFPQKAGEAPSAPRLFIMSLITVLINFDLTGVTNLSCLESNQLQCLSSSSSAGAICTTGSAAACSRDATHTPSWKAVSAELSSQSWIYCWPKQQLIDGSKPDGWSWSHRLVNLSEPSGRSRWSWGMCFGGYQRRWNNSKVHHYRNSSPTNQNSVVMFSHSSRQNSYGVSQQNRRVTFSKKAKKKNNQTKKIKCLRTVCLL